MQFITTDQRIAVENFEVGMIYTVTFSNANNFTGACIGIGVDFVVFQRTAPEYIFCLTMTTAADVASIDPLSADIGQILEYTGTVPVSIKTDGSPLLDYLITGNTVQNGTPSPSSPIQPQGCGELETVGAKAGQYKIPISSANTTTPVYLGEVETTRKIRKFVLTGEEDWVQSVSGVKVYRINVSDYLRKIDNIPICTHYKGIASVAGTGNLQDLETTFLLSSSGNNYYYIRDDRFNNANDFKTYLAQQYAAGTPVTVWYVLATPTTGIVNEPLMKIGDYTDTLSMEQAGANIPTNNGSTTVDVGTTVKPSEVYIKYFSPLF